MLGRIGMQGLDENMMAMLKQQYPARLMPQLVQTSQDTLQVSALTPCVIWANYVTDLNP